MERFQLVSALPLLSVSGDISAEALDGAVTGLARFGAGCAGDLSFCDREPEASIGDVPTGAFVLCPDSLMNSLRDRFPGAIFLCVADARAAFIDCCERLVAADAVALSDAVPRPSGVHRSAQIGTQTVIHPEARIDEDVHVGAHSVLGRGTWIQRGAVVKEGVTIGTEGINDYRGLDGRRRGFPHLASAIIGEGAEIGAGSVVTRGILTSTRVGSGSVVGCLCYIGHGAELGESVRVAAGSVVGGHTRIGSGAILGLRVAVRDNITVGVGVQLGMGSVLTKSVPDRSLAFGNPARVIRQL